MVAVMQPLAASFARQSTELFPAHNRDDIAAHGPLIKAGVRVAFSSDLPVTPDPNPWPGMRAAIEDQVNGLSTLEALRAYTSAGAYASFDENVKGTLEPGKVADLQIYAGDPLEAPRQRWKALRPRAVLVGGALVSGSF
jgi:predicted amidohydrolase YtcJ